MPGKFKQYEANGISMTIAEWAALLGTTTKKLHGRIQYAGSLQAALAMYARTGTVNPSAKQYEFAGLRMPLLDWAQLTGISKEALRDRLRRGWSVEKTVTTATPEQISRGIGDHRRTILTFKHEAQQ